MVPKFRAWHMPFGSKGPMQEMIHGKASSILAFAEMSPDKYIVEQATGLKDANGNMIYENDILCFGRMWLEGDEYDPREEDHIGLVKYCSDSASYVVDCNKQIFPLEQMCSFDGYSAQGNVHTKPELLEAQHDTRTA